MTDVGIVPTPLLYFSVLHWKMDGGAMITGSHNAAEYNGFKLGVGPTTIFGVEIQKLADIVEKMDEAGSDHERLNTLNAEFHIAVARMSGNKLTMDLVGILRSATRVEMETVVGDSPDWSQSAHMLTIEHGDILRALEHGDEETAAKLIGSHISRFYQDRAC